MEIADYLHYPYLYKVGTKTQSQCLATGSENTHTYRNTACKVFKNFSYVSIQQRETLHVSFSELHLRPAFSIAQHLS